MEVIFLRLVFFPVVRNPSIQQYLNGKLILISPTLLPLPYPPIQ
jgi:hypothetical protein